MLDKNWQKTCNDFFKDSLNKTSTIESCIEEETSASTSSSVLVCTSTSKIEKKEECVLDLPAFQKYVNIFRKIRLQHIITDLGSLNVLYTDRIIPQDWIEPYYFKSWLNTIYIDQDQLSHEFEINPAEFDLECARFGRILNGELATWRWVFRNSFYYSFKILG